MNSFSLKSTAFKDGELMPVKFTCDGENVNPFLEIKNIPESTKSLALIVDDPDATRGIPFDHWLMWNIPADTHYIEEDSVPFHAIQGVNSFGNKRYGGPCPPKGGSMHHYVFHIYALNKTLELTPTASKGQFLEAIEGNVIADAKLIGVYQR